MDTIDTLARGWLFLIVVGALAMALAIGLGLVEGPEPLTLCERLAAQEPAQFDLEDCQRRFEVGDSLAATGVRPGAPASRPWGIVGR